MRRRFGVLFLGAMILASYLALPARAAEPPSGKVRYKREPALCNRDDGSVDIGGSVFMGEQGKYGVTQMRIEWQLHTKDPNGPGLENPFRRTVFSAKFPDNRTSYYWNGREGAAGGGGNWVQWNDLNAQHEYWLYAKMTWDRPGKRDWNYRLPVVRC